MRISVRFIFLRIKSGCRGKKQTEGYKKKFHVALFFTIVLSAAIAVMFGITYVSGHSPYVVDYENELIDKYENWQKELEKGKRQ